MVGAPPGTVWSGARRRGPASRLPPGAGVHRARNGLQCRMSSSPPSQARQPSAPLSCGRLTVAPCSESARFTPSARAGRRSDCTALIVVGWATAGLRPLGSDGTRLGNDLRISGAGVAESSTPRLWPGTRPPTGAWSSGWTGQRERPQSRHPRAADGRTDDMEGPGPWWSAAPVRRRGLRRATKGGAVRRDLVAGRRHPPSALHPGQPTGGLALSAGTGMVSRRAQGPGTPCHNAPGRTTGSRPGRSGEERPWTKVLPARGGKAVRGAASRDRGGNRRQRRDGGHLARRP